MVRQRRLRASTTSRCTPSGPTSTTSLRAIAVFDAIANNTDRKSGHCLLEIDSGDGGDRVWAIDNGLCFSADDKLRTVIWEFAGDRCPTHLRRAVATAPSTSPAELAGLARRRRGRGDRPAGPRRLACDAATFPAERHSHGYPWPLV